jgi:hypothetical protein
MTEAHSSRVHGSAPTHPGSRHHCPSVALWMKPALAPCVAVRAEPRAKPGRGSRELVPSQPTCKQAQANTGNAVHP